MLHVGDVELELELPVFYGQLESCERNAVAFVLHCCTCRWDAFGGSCWVCGGVAQSGVLGLGGLGELDELGETVKQRPQAFGKAEDVVNASIRIWRSLAVFLAAGERRRWIFLIGQASSYWFPP